MVSFDGLPMASALPPGMDEDRVAAMSAALLSLGERAAQGLGRGDLSQVYVEGDNGTVFLVSADDEAVLVAVGRVGRQGRSDALRGQAGGCRRRYLAARRGPTPAAPRSCPQPVRDRARDRTRERSAGAQQPGAAPAPAEPASVPQVQPVPSAPQRRTTRSATPLTTTDPTTTTPFSRRSIPTSAAQLSWPPTAAPGPDPRLTRTRPLSRRIVT